MEWGREKEDEKAKQRVEKNILKGRNRQRSRHNMVTGCWRKEGEGREKGKE